MGKTLVFYFHGKIYNQCDHLGYRHNEFVDENVFSVAAKIFATGLNIMLIHNSDKTHTVMVDDKKFQQR